MSAPNRRQLIGGMLAGGLGLTLLGRVPSPGEASARSLSPPGTRVDPSKPEGTDLLPQIRHIVVLMMENHSFDNYFGTLGRGDGLALAPDGAPAATNPDQVGDPVRAFYPGTSDQTGFQTRLGWNNVFRQVGGGAMDGFVQFSGHEAMSYFTDAEIPFYRSMARTFPLCDRWFCSVPGATYPNRRFLSAATAAGLSNTDPLTVLAHPTAPNGTIYERLDDLGISWWNYSAGLPEVALWPEYFARNQHKIRPIHEFYQACATSSLPAYSIVTPSLDNDEHPPKDISAGERFSAGVVRALLDSDAWQHSVLVFTYDEHGGFYDHVPPPPAIPPGDGIAPQFEDGESALPGAEGYDRYGVRVPAVILSPFARPDHVSSVVHDHTSILRLLETKWNIGAITQRDANASNLLDSLDLTAPPAFAQPPELAAPAYGWPDIRVLIRQGQENPNPIEPLVPHTDPAVQDTPPGAPPAAAPPSTATPRFTG